MCKKQTSKLEDSLQIDIALFAGNLLCIEKTQTLLFTRVREVLSTLNKQVEELKVPIQVYILIHTSEPNSEEQIGEYYLGFDGGRTDGNKFHFAYASRHQTEVASNVYSMVNLNAMPMRYLVSWGAKIPLALQRLMSLIETRRRDTEEAFKRFMTQLELVAKD